MEHRSLTVWWVGSNATIDLSWTQLFFSPSNSFWSMFCAWAVDRWFIRRKSIEDKTKCSPTYHWPLWNAISPPMILNRLCRAPGRMPLGRLFAVNWSCLATMRPNSWALWSTQWLVHRLLSRTDRWERRQWLTHHPKLFPPEEYIFSATTNTSLKNWVNTIESADLMVASNYLSMCC